LDQTLQAAQLDALNLLIWQNTKDGAKGRKRPKSVVDMLNKKAEKKDDLETYSSGAEFEARRRMILEGNYGH
jgi:hypothetical protein